MKKSKLVSLISIGVILFYSLSLFMIYYTAKSVASERFEAQSRQYNSQFHSCINAARDKVILGDADEYKNETEIFKDIVFEAGTYGSSAAISAILDEEGNILAKTEPAIKLEFCNGHWEPYETHVISLEPYLTEDIKNEIRAFYGTMLSSYCKIYRAHFYKSEDGYVPVKIFLEGTDFETLERREKEIKLTDLPVDLTVGENAHEYISMSSELFYINNEEDFVRNLENVKEALDESVAWIKNDEFESVGGSTQKGRLNETQMSYELFLFKMDGKTYRSFNAMSHTLTKSTLESDEFEDGAIYLGMLFAAAGAVITLFSLALNNKKKNLDKAVNSFSVAAAHELKTPLAVIQNQCECIMESIAPEKNEEYIKSIYDESLRMNELVINMLEYSRITSDGYVKKEKCDLCEIVRDTAEKHKGFAESKDVKLTVDIKAERAVVKCNKKLMALAVNNYISNAEKFAKGDKNVTITLEGKQGYYIINVYNDGDGISGELKPFLWNTFTKEDKARTSGSGSGMGLALCKKIFDFHNCTYGFKNKEKGVEFWVMIE